MSANAGVAYVSIDGKRQRLVGSLTYQPDGLANEPLMGMDGYHGQKETFKQGMIKGTFRNADDVDIAAINRGKNVTVTAELNNGKVVVGRNMTRNGDPITVNAEDGTFDAEWAGPDVREIKA